MKARSQALSARPSCRALPQRARTRHGTKLSTMFSVTARLAALYPATRYWWAAVVPGEGSNLGAMESTDCWACAMRLGAHSGLPYASLRSQPHSAALAGCSLMAASATQPGCCHGRVQGAEVQGHSAAEWSPTCRSG